MKKFLAFAFLFVSFVSYHAQAQVVTIPNKSKDHLAKKYPGATHTVWDNNVASYTCRFTWKNGEYKAFYHMDGTWDYSVHYLTESTLPKAVQDAVAKSRISDWKPKSAVKLENNKGEHLYRVERKKGIEIMYLFFDEKGKEVKSSLAI
jgi:Putative beta-lactamase-inhibitor-like, PepSY-like